MASLLLKSAGFEGRVLQLKLGVNRLGRGLQNDFIIDHPSVSARHCELLLTADGLVVRDRRSTNGTFVDGQEVSEISLKTGQLLQLGEIRILVESTGIEVAIPQFDIPVPAPPVVKDGRLLCPRHPEMSATYQCTYCREVLCGVCVHRLRRRGGRVHVLCPLCSHKCVSLGGGEEKPKRSIFKLLQNTVKLRFIR